MRVIEVGILNLKMHAKTDFDVKHTEVYVTEGIGFNLFSLHSWIKRAHTCSIDSSLFLVMESDHACMPLV